MKKSLFSSSYTNTYFVLNSKVKDFVKQLNKAYIYFVSCKWSDHCKHCVV